MSTRSNTRRTARYTRNMYRLQAVGHGFDESIVGRLLQLWRWLKTLK